MNERLGGLTNWRTISEYYDKLYVSIAGKAPPLVVEADRGA